MATHTHTTGHSPRERSRLPIVAAGGPVTRALAVMAADPNTPRIVELRRAIAERIQADLDLLDALDGDPDLEASFGYVQPGYLDEAEPDHDDEPSLCGTTVSWPSDSDLELDDSNDEPSLGSLESAPVMPGLRIGREGCDPSTSQLRWGASSRSDREQENEHGGDVCDEPHDPEEDGDNGDDGDLGRGRVTFDGTNYHAVRPLFRIEGGRFV